MENDPLEPVVMSLRSGVGRAGGGRRARLRALLSKIALAAVPRQPCAPSPRALRPSRAATPTAARTPARAPPRCALRFRRPSRAPRARADANESRRCGDGSAKTGPRLNRRCTESMRRYAGAFAESSRRLIVSTAHELRVGQRERRAILDDEIDDVHRLRDFDARLDGQLPGSATSAERSHPRPLRLERSPRAG